MKPVEGIKLEDVVNEAVQDVAKEHKTRIFTQIRSILTDLRNWRAEQEKSEKALEKLKGKILAAEKKVEELKGGKWDALAEPQQSKPQEPTTPDQSS
jgi:chromosome segregation ATPase